jgi:hypothetical protein
MVGAMLRSRPIALVVLAVSALTTACFEEDSGPQPNASLEDLPGKRLIAEIARDIVGGSGALARLAVRLEYDDVAFQVRHDGDCALLDDSLAITWSGVTEEVEYRGRRFGSGGECPSPSHAIVIDDVGATELALGDDSGVLSVRFDDVLRDRSAGLLSTSRGLKSGDQLTVRVPSPEQVAWAEIRPPGDDAGYFLDLAQADGAVTLTLPTPLPFTGDGVLVVSLGAVEAPVLSCPSGVACALGLSTHYRTDVQLVP